jgi:hydroxymethylglutaryl-CoA reductase (NADPH)
MNIKNYKIVSERRKAVEKEMDVDLKNIGSFTPDEKTAATKNCENMIGVAQVPMGVAGPLLLRGKGEGESDCEYYLPLATTEGALVASVNRGCKAITESGGATVGSYRAGATRGPVFRVKGYKESTMLWHFFQDQFEALREVAEQTSHHLTLTKITSRGVGRYHYARFVFDTKDAMGLNMATIATDAMVSFVKEKTGIPCLSLSGNYCVDKKPSWQNIVYARGTEAWAEAVLTEKVISRVLKTSAQKVYDVWLAKCMVGSAVSGSMAFNAQFANIVAAIFLATGQDIAHVVEGGLGITTAEVTGCDLYVSVHMPDLMVGTVGGGTGLATQREALSLLGVAGGNNGINAQRLAEIVGATVLAGEISLLASLGEGSLARAHRTLGRGEHV